MAASAASFIAKNPGRRFVLLFGVLSCFVSFSEAATPEPGILSHESSVSTRQPVYIGSQKLRSAGPSSSTLTAAPASGSALPLPGREEKARGVFPADGENVKELKEQPAPLFVPDARTATGAASAENSGAPAAGFVSGVGEEQVLDVYALSPHARLLALPHMMTPELARRVEAGVAPDWEAIISEASRLFNLDRALIASVIRVESSFQHLAESSRGAQGAMQIMPQTQAHLGLADPFDPRANVHAGSRYLREQLNAFGSLELALAAYNAGPANVRKYGGIPPFEETQNFVRKVMAGM